MPHLVERESWVAPRLDGDERIARAELRRQIGRLERQLAALTVEGFPRLRIETSASVGSGPPRILGLGELEALRDALAGRVEDARRALSEREESYERARELRERMLAAPAEHKWVQVSREDVGEPGCGHWHSLPRFGLLGMLMGWWRVRISSGCPSAGRLAAVERATTAG